MNDETVAYQRPTPTTWRHRTEHLLNRMYDMYAALWDIMPAVAAFAALLWLINTAPNLHK